MPLAVALVRLRDARRVRRALGLPEPPARSVLARPLALTLLFALLGLAAAGPALRIQHDRRERKDAQVVVALDSSRSMLAASAPGAAQRWQRAKAFARRLRSDLPGVPMGLSSLTNRLLPYLFPTADAHAYDRVLGEAYGIQRPPPALTIDRWVTVFDPLADVTVGQFFSPDVHRRVLVVLSDAEAHPFDAAALLQRLERSGTTPVVVRFWHAGERIFRPGASSYRATEPGAVAALRGAGWQAFPESQLDAAVARIRSDVGSGPLVRVGVSRREIALAPWLALAALLPLAALLLPGGHAAAAAGRLKARLRPSIHSESMRRATPETS